MFMAPIWLLRFAQEVQVIEPCDLWLNLWSKEYSSRKARIRRQIIVSGEDGVWPGRNEFFLVQV
jgi:hypothetical protein